MAVPISLDIEGKNPQRNSRYENINFLLTSMFPSIKTELGGKTNFVPFTATIAPYTKSNTESLKVIRYNLLFSEPKAVVFGKSDYMDGRVILDLFFDVGGKAFISDLYSKCDSIDKYLKYKNIQSTEALPTGVVNTNGSLYVSRGLLQTGVSTISQLGVDTLSGLYQVRYQIGFIYYGDK